MDFPKRDVNHIGESKSLEILKKDLPDEWIVREITERDYGIDLYVGIVGKDRKVTGNLVAIQVKSKRRVTFVNNKYIFSGINKSTFNYWQGLPVPVFFVLVCLQSEKAYWRSINEVSRLFDYNNKNKTFSIQINKTSFDEVGLNFFLLAYYKEKIWHEIVNATEQTLMLYNSFGPFYLYCKRQRDKHPNKAVPSTIQFLLLQHYEYYSILGRYLMFNKPHSLPFWYDKLKDYINKSKLPISTFTYDLAIEMLNYFTGDYLDVIEVVYNMVTKHEKQYWYRKNPYLCMHLEWKPLIFVQEDWFARYYFDEYENETVNIESRFFEDYDFL